MVTYCISPRCVVLIISCEELPSVRDFVNSCLKIKVRRLWRDIDFDVFPGLHGEIMLIARPASPELRRADSLSLRLGRR